MGRWPCALSGLAIAAALGAFGAFGPGGAAAGEFGIVLHEPEQATLAERAAVRGELRRFDVETRLAEARRAVEADVPQAPARRARRAGLIAEREALDQRFFRDRELLEREIGEIGDPRLRAESAAELRRIEIERSQRQLLREQELRSRRAFERRPHTPGHPAGLRPHRPGLGPRRPGLRR
jgi:hypothetical protein